MILQLAQDVVVTVAQDSILPLLWAFANSPLGISLVSGVILWLLSKIVTAKPSYLKYYNQYRGLFFDAVRHAERTIPDNTQSSAGAKADLALKYLLELEPTLNKAPQADLANGIVQAVAHGAADVRPADVGA